MLDFVRLRIILGITQDTEEPMSDFFDAEQQVMSSVINGNTTDLLPEDLSDDRHQEMLRAIIALRDDGIVPDVITINQKMIETSGSQLSDMKDYLNELSNLYSNPKRQGTYEGIIKDGALRRQVIKHATSILKEAEHGALTDDLLIMAQTKSIQLGAGRKTAENYLAQDVAFDVLEDIKQRRGGNTVTGLETPWKKVNQLTSGLQNRDLIIIAGRPSMGKTVLAAQIAYHAAWVEGPVFIGSLEMDKSSLVERMLVGEARVDAESVRSGYYREGDYSKLQGAAEKMQDLHPIVINDSSRLTAQDLRMAMTKAHLKYKGLSCAVIDYLGLIKGDSMSRQRYLEVGEAAKIMRATAKDLDIPVVLVCQLNRDCEKRDNKRPILADLRESGDIEQDADVVMMLYRDQYYCTACATETEMCEKDHDGIAEVIIRKQRKGATGTATLAWNPTFTTFDNLGYGDSYDGER